MADPAMDIECRVATYELWRADKLAAKQGRPIFDPPNMPHLVAVSRAKVVRPTRQALNLAVGTLIENSNAKMARCQKAPDLRICEIGTAPGARGCH